MGLTGDDYLSAAAFTPGYESAQLICGVLLVAGGAVSFVGLRGTRQLVS